MSDIDFVILNRPVTEFKKWHAVRASVDVVCDVHARVAC